MPSSSSVQSSPSPPPFVGCYGTGNGNSSSTTNGHSIIISLTDLLSETELEQYEQALRVRLKILRAEHLKDVRESDLSEIGMSKPEQRRLMKAFHKYFPSSSLARKFKQKVLHRKVTGPSTSTGAAVVGGGGSTSWNTAAGGASTSSSSPYNLRRCNSNEEASAATAAADVEDDSSLSLNGTTEDDEQHIIPASNIILCRQLGQGEFGTVWQGVWNTTARGGPARYHHRTTNSASSQTKIQVAVKKIMPQKMLTSSMDFVREAAIMHRIHHEHVVRFFGVVLDTNTIMLVTELAPSRSLSECLKEERSSERFSIVQLCDFAQQICSGMAYLESNRFIHRDLAARNILVFSTHKVKISDFGLSRALGTGEEYYRGNFNVNLKLPIAWCAPECINYLKFTSASDVWAYGVALWEMFTYGFQPWAGMNGQQIFEAVNAPRMCRLECPDACPSDYYALMLEFWRHEPETRPKFADILTVLPTIEPERVRTVRECRDGQLDHLQYGSDAVITVLDKTPALYPDGHYWRGASKNGRTGLFLPTNTVAYLESLRPGMPATNLVTSVTNGGGGHKNHHNSINNHHHQSKSAGGFIRTAIDSLGGLTRRSAGRPGVNGGFAKNGGARPLISLPQNDLRHTGHLGLDGMCFGDVPTQVNGLTIISHTSTATTSKKPIPVIEGPMSTSVNQQKQHRLKSYSSETAYLLSPDDEYGTEENSRRSGGGGFAPDLDDVQPVSIVCGDSGGWLLDEVLEALNQDRSSRTDGGCTNMGARFSTEDGTDPLSSATEPPTSPSSVPEEDELDDEEMSNDRRRLWSAAADSNVKKATEDSAALSSKANKEKTVKPLSQSDMKMLNDIDKLADKLSAKALDKERDRLYEERRRLGLGGDDENAERSPSPSSDSMKRQLIRKFRRGGSPINNGEQRPSFTDSLALKCDGGDIRISPEAENAYKTLIEGRGNAPSSVLLPREERDDPQRPSVEEDHRDQNHLQVHSNDVSADDAEDETNPLRMLRNEGANVVRRFNRQGSGRRQNLIDKPTPPIRRRVPDTLTIGVKPTTDSKPSPRQPLGIVNPAHEMTNGDGHCHQQHQNGIDSTASESRPFKKPPPPPVPPRTSPRMDAERSPKPERSKPSSQPPAIPPKPKLSGSPPVLTRSEKTEVVRVAPEPPPPVVPVVEERKRSSQEEDNKRAIDVCPTFTLDDVNKYDLLDFVLSGLPEARKAEERRKLINDRVPPPRPSSSSSAASSNSQSGRTNGSIPREGERESIASRKEILIEDDVVHV